MKDFYEIYDELKSFVRKYYDLLKIRESLVTNIAIYNQLINDIQSFLNGDFSCSLNIDMCLETLYGNRYSDLQNSISKCKILSNFESASSDVKMEKDKISEYLDDIREDFVKTRYRISRLDEKVLKMRPYVFSCKRILSCVKLKQKISPNDIELLNQLLRDFGYDNKQVSYIIENVFARNRSIDARIKGYSLNPDEKYKYIDLIKCGGEIFTIPDVSNKAKLDNFAESIYSGIMEFNSEYGEENYIEYFPTVGVELKNLNEFEYVLIVVLKKLKLALDELVEMLESPEFIMDLEAKKELANESYKIIQNYNMIRNYMDKILDESLYNETDVQQGELSTPNSVLQVFYLVNGSNKCCLIEDMKDMPYEYIEKTKQLIDGLKDGTLPVVHIKKLSHKKGFYELKDDQIRIIFQKGENNSYLICGAFVKKDDWKYRLDFNRVIGRPLNIGEDTLEIESNISDYVNSHKRKGSR